MPIVNMEVVASSDERSHRQASAGWTYEGQSYLVCVLSLCNSAA